MNGRKFRPYAHGNAEEGLRIQHILDAAQQLPNLFERLKAIESVQMLCIANNPRRAHDLAPEAIKPMILQWWSENTDPNLVGTVWDQVHQ